METIEISLSKLREAPWNPNRIDPRITSRLRESLTRFGMIQNLVVRPMDDGSYEVLSGNQRLNVLREAGAAKVPCVVVDLDDAEAKLLAQALNRIHGEDDLGLKAELVRDVLGSLPREKVLSLLPETAATLDALAALGQEDLAEHLQAWERARAVRLKHVTFQVTGRQQEVVEEAMERAMEGAIGDDFSPNRKGNALHRICQDYLGGQSA